MFEPTSTIVELYDEVAQRGEGDDLSEYHVRLYRITLSIPGRLGFYLTRYLYHFTDIYWGAATEDNDYYPRRASRTKIVGRGSDPYHIRKAISYVDAFNGLKGDR